MRCWSKSSIYRITPSNHLKVQMKSSRATRRAKSRNHLGLLHYISDFHEKSIYMGIARDHRIRVFDIDYVAIFCIPISHAESRVTGHIGGMGGHDGVEYADRW